MEKKSSIEELIKQIESFKLPGYKDLPEIPLYMEQVVSYVKEALGILGNNNDISITPFMINNYVKAKIIDSPSEKKYNQRHLGYLIAISLLKSVVNMKDLATFIDIDRSEILKKNNSDTFLYDVFKELEEDALHNAIHKVKVLNEVFKKAAKKNKNKKENSEEIEKANLSYIALRLYVESEANKLIADMIMQQIGQDTFKNLDTSKYDRKKIGVEAKKLRDREKGAKK